MPCFCVILTLFVASFLLIFTLFVTSFVAFTLQRYKKFLKYANKMNIFFILVLF